LSACRNACISSWNTQSHGWQTEGRLLEDNIDRPDSIKDWLDEVMSLPPVPGYKPGAGTAVIRAMRDAIDRV
jgi:hypothetical protein